MILGFSMTGEDLEDDYLVTYIGEEKTAERRLLGLELTPKKDKMRAIVSKIDLWVDQASWLPARQVIERASGGGTLTVDFALMARNLNLKDELFDDDWPKGTQKVKQ